MLFLVTDTSGRNGSVALARAEDRLSDEVHVIESAALTGGTFSAQLVPQIAALLAKHGFTKTQIDAFIVVSGPGSFTGLRVGLAAIKALAEILAKPIVAVSLLEVLALAGGGNGKVISAIDAGRGELYAGEYEFANGATRLIREKLLSKEEFLESAGGSSVVTVDLSLAAQARTAGLAALPVDTISSEMIARLGWRKLRSGETIDPAQLDANYIRRTDAEIFAKPDSRH
ncbi:MAG TPA: tRNA (adenosine(37)-N6)-threonylcarbamoyltransferase complex dimerization subunit type 1 TsaB [Candidatus Sulfotelmatobacter sp.]|nr:tRNA (adenosine(37)-N6)-threonylcarbamoyltransferase complex dimerization subunit type 1 TsaB [Candidatus Sulfotelmatobacter sp.]